MNDKMNPDEIKTKLRVMAYNCGGNHGCWNAGTLSNAADIIDRLTAENAELLQKTQQLEQQNAELEEVNLLDLRQLGGRVDLSLKGLAARAFMAVLVGTFEEAKATNFLTVTVDYNEHHYGITIQKADGELTPEEKMAQLETERDAAVKALREMHFAYINKDADCPHSFEKVAIANAEQIIGKRGEESE